jgi:membrane-anchored glycerophosphoryl diester phosphodiesterase (GDPDase)
VAVAMSGAASVLTKLLLGVGGLLAAVFAIYASIKFIVAYPAIFVDDLSAIESIRASWNMTRGHWWRLAAILGTITIIAIVLAIVLAIVGAIVGATLKARTTGGIVAIQLTAIVVYSFLGSLSPAMLIALYDDLKLRTEGGDLAGRVSALASR